MAMQINTNKANLSNKVLLYFSYPLKHTHYNLLGGIVWICGLLPFLPFFGVLRNSLILPHQWHSPEKSRLLHCQPHRVPVLFDSVFCGSLDTPQPPHPRFFQHPFMLYCLALLLFSKPDSGWGWGLHIERRMKGG